MAAGVALTLAAILAVPWLREVLAVSAPGAAEFAAAGATVLAVAAWVVLLRARGARRAGASRGTARA
jgi:hypothetical protein